MDLYDLLQRFFGSIMILNLLKSFLGHELGAMSLLYQLLKMPLLGFTVTSVVLMHSVEDTVLGGVLHGKIRF